MNIRTWLDSTAKDVRYAVRGLRNDLGFAVVAVIALAVGIAANTPVFTVVNAMFFKNLPFAGSDRVVYFLSPNVRDLSSPDSPSSFPDYLDIRAQAKSFDGLVAYRLFGANISDPTDFAARYSVMQMTINGLSTIRQKPVIGRDFAPEDERPDGELVAILTDKMWNSRYGRSPAVLGTTIRIDGTPVVIVGVTGPDVKFGGDNDLFLPIRPNFNTASGPAAAFWTRRDRRQMLIFGRLADGVTLASANAEAAALAKQLATAYPATNKETGARVMTYSQATFNPRIKALTLALQAAVAFVLLIACSNVANLLIARGVKRWRELSIRVAMGASRGRIVRQLLLESVILSMIGGAVGWVLTILGVQAFIAALPPGQLPSTLDISIDRNVFIGLALISIGAGLLFGLFPAIRTSKTDIHSLLKDATQGSTGGGVRTRLMTKALVVSAVALATVLLVGAGLMIRSLLYMERLPLGITPSSVFTMRINLAGTRYGRAEAQTAFFDRLTTMLEAVPGVESASIATTLPANGWMRSGALAYNYEIEGGPPTEPQRLPRTAGASIGPSFFRVLQAKLLAGRELTATDDGSTDPVLIVNQSFAARAWPAGDAVGRRVRFFGDGAPASWVRVVGVVADILDNDFSRGQPFVYVPYAQMPVRGMYVMARTRVPPETVAEPARRAVQTIDRDLPVTEVGTFEQHVELSRLDLRLFSRVFLVFGVIALLLACTGLYAVVAHLVAQRRAEIGVRLAIGANPGHILRLIVTSGMGQIAVGLVLGVLASLVLMRKMRAIITGVSTADPITLATVVVLLGGAGLLGCAVPAYRALRVDPVTTLRAQ